MRELKFAVIGNGATGAVLGAALLTKDPETILVDPAPGLGEALLNNGINISGAISYPSVPVKNFYSTIQDIKVHEPNIIFICTKTFHLDAVLNDLGDVVQKGTKIISTHNGLGPEDLISEKFGADSVFRMSLNYGVALKGPGVVESAFFNKPNYLGCFDPGNKAIGLTIAGLLTESGLDTELVDDIKLFVWKKMITKCTLASICAVTDRTIKDVLNFPPTREIADACFQEALAVAKAKGYDLGDDILKESLAYLEKVGVHKDSMCVDIANKTRTEIDFLGGKVVEYGRETGVPTPYFTAMANLVRALEDNFLRD